MKLIIYTIGHSNVTVDEFLSRLIVNGISILADVRSVPVSRYVPHFNYDAIEPALHRKGIDYEYMGDRLGGRPRRSDYNKGDGTPDYEKMAGDELFIEGLEMAMRMSRGGTVCLMCSEEDPAKCHRTKLISAQLSMRSVEVRHILGDGSIETEEHNARRRVTVADRQLELF